MKRNVFISFLGTTDYVETIYQWEDKKESSPTRFIQEAILERTAKTWTEKDAIYIFCTKKSYNVNWVDDGHKDRNGNILKREGLDTRLKKLKQKENLKTVIDFTIVEEGFTENDVWSIFETVYNKLNDNDQIYFDITHAFRSIPLFASSLFNFAQYMKNVSVVSVNYGAFEKLLDKIPEGKKISDLHLNERIAPIVDMTNIVRLQELTETAVSITSFGRSPRTISENMKKLTGDQDKYTIDMIIKAVSELDEFIQSNRRHGLRSGSYLERLEEVKKKYNKSETIRQPVREIINKIKGKIEDFGFERNNPNANIIGAIKWSQEFDMLAQAYTLGREYILTVLQEKYNELNPFKSEDQEENDRNYREFLSSVLTITDSKIKKNELYDNFNKYPYQFFTLLNEDIIKELRDAKAYPKLAEYRNIINHGKGNAQNDRNNGNTSYKTIKEIFEKSFYKCTEIILKYNNSCQI